MKKYKYSLNNALHSTTLIFIYVVMIISMCLLGFLTDSKWVYVVIVSLSVGIFIFNLFPFYYLHFRKYMNEKSSKEVDHGKENDR